MPESRDTKKPRARDLGIPFEGAPGKLNAITDVSGIEVGFSTIVSGEAKAGGTPAAARTGVTVIFPRGKESTDPVMGGFYSFNGNGEMTGMHWVQEGGFIETPIAITNTHSVGMVQHSIVKWQAENKKFFQDFSLPVVAETADCYLSDINGFHVTERHTFEALNSARGGTFEEGNVGGGTGMLLFEWKGGTGTSSRKLSEEDGGFTVGVLVQGNFGRRAQCTIAGVPVGKELPEDAVYTGNQKQTGNSIIVVVATDAPLVPHQLNRLARRATVGLSRTGGMGNNSSGDIFLSFSTANPNAANPGGNGIASIKMVSNSGPIDKLIAATVYATEEAIVNAMVAAETMTGFEGHTVQAIPHDRLQDILKKYNRLDQR